MWPRISWRCLQTEDHGLYSSALAAEGLLVYWTPHANHRVRFVRVTALQSTHSGMASRLLRTRPALTRTEPADVSWKRIQKEVERTTQGRFPLCPARSDEGKEQTFRTSTGAQMQVR